MHIPRVAPASFVLAALLASAAALRAGDPPAAGGQDGAREITAFRQAREALADRDYKAAVEKLSAFQKEFPASPLADDAGILLGRARELSGDAEGALASLAAFIKEKPQSPYAAKARLLMADAYIALKRFADAADIYRARLEFLRGDAYRDRIAGYYLEVADPAFAGRPVQDPSTLLKREVLQHDYATALEYYRRALSVMGAGKLKAERGDEIRARIGRSYLELGKHGEAVEVLASLISERGKDLAPKLLGDGLFDLGLAYLKVGAADKAVEAFARIENELGDHPRAPEAVKAIGEIETARAFATPGEKERKAFLERGLAALERFLKKFPQSALAPEVAFASGDAMAKAGRHPEAIARFRELIEKHGKDERAPAAQLRIAEFLAEDHAYQEAVAAWKKFLGTYASDPRWAEAQAKIDQALYEEGLWLLKEKKKPEEARAAWTMFLAERPASPLAPEVYRRFHDLALEAKDHPKAADALRMIVEKYPASPQAPAAALDLARLLGGPMDDFEGAIREYEGLVAKFPQSAEAGAAAAALAEMRGKHLALVAPRVFHTGEPWTLKVETRNIGKLKLKAYRVNLEEYFRKKLAVEGVEGVAVGLVEPTKTWDFEVGLEEKGGYRPYKLFSGEKKLPLPEDEVGAYIVTAEEEALQATVLAVRSDLALVEKASPRQTFLWAVDERSGEPVAGVRVVLADPAGVFFEGKTGAEGILAVDHKEPRPDVRVLAVVAPEPRGAAGGLSAGLALRGGELRGFHYATGKTAAPAEVAYGYTTKVHVTTDRPLYRPNQTVNFRAILRKVVEGRYGSSEGETAEVTITNPLGVILYQETLKANEFGAVAGKVELTDEPPLGEYAVAVNYQGQGFAGKFKVEEYRKPEFSVSLKTEKTSYLHGEEVKGKIAGEYLFGGPVPRAKVTWSIFQGPYAFDASRFDENRWFFSPKEKKEKAVGGFKLIAQGSGETDEKGELPFAFTPVADGHDHTYRVQLEATDLSRVTVAGSDDVIVTAQEIYVVARADRKVYRAGDRVTASFRTVDAASRPVDAKGEATLEKRSRGEGPGGGFFLAVEKQDLATAGGKGDVSFAVKEPGEYRVTFRTKDRAGNGCEGWAQAQVAGEEPDLAKEARILFEKAVYHQGEEAKLFVNSPVTGRKALLTFEGDRVIAHRIVEAGKKSFELTAVMESSFSPNIAVAVAIPGVNALHQAKDEAVVLQYLQVEVKSDKPEYRPGEEAALEVTALDQGGKPREAELSLAVIDGAVLQLQPDLVEPVKPYFYDQRRAHAVGTASTQSFSYAGVTSQKSKELLAEEERRKRDVEKEELTAEGKEVMDTGLANGARARRLAAPATAKPGESAKGDVVDALRKGLGVAGPGGGAVAFGGRPAAKTASRARGLERGETLDRDKAAGVEKAAEAAGDLFEAPALALDELVEDGAARDPAGHALFFDSLGLNEGLARGYWGVPHTGQPGSPQPAEPQIRRRFADTALWRSDVRTGKDGKARVSFKVPDNLTGWRAALVGSTAAAGDTLVGDGETRFRSKKGILLRIQAPRFLTREDQASLITPVHNYLPEAAQVSVEMVAKDLEAKSVSKTALKIGAGDIGSVDWDVLPRPVAGGMLTAKALSEKESDAIEQSIPVIPFGKRIHGGQGGLLDDEAVARFTFPAALVEGTARLRVEVSPRFSDDLRRAVLYLHVFPYGCVEQTVSGFVAAMALDEALRKLGAPDQDLRNMLQDLVPKRIVKILNAQRPSGGWGWWGASDSSGKGSDASDPRMTALALQGLEAARLAGFRVQDDRLEKGRVRAASLLKGAADPEAAALLAYALSFSKKAPAEELNRLWRGRDSAPPSAIALLGLAYAAQDQRVQASEAAKLLASRAQDLTLNGKVQGAFVKDRAGRENPPDVVIATAYTLLLLDRVEPESAVAPRLYQGLMALRKGIHWQTTDATAAAVVSLASHGAREAVKAAEAEVTVEVNGEALKTLRVSPTRPGDEAPVLEVPEAKLKKGENQVVLKKKGSGRFGYTVVWDAVGPAEKIVEEGNLLKVRREYVAYVPPKPQGDEAPAAAQEAESEDGISSVDPPTRIAGADAAWLVSKEPPAPGFRIVEATKRPPVKPRTIEKTTSGDKVRVVLTLEAREDLEYMLLEDPIPAGCEVIDDPERFEGSYDRKEVHDQKVVFFRSKLPRGTHVLAYLLRPTFPGRYRALPTLASLMYEPGIFGLSADGRMTIQRPEAREPEPPPELTADEKLYEIERAFAALSLAKKAAGVSEALEALRQKYLEVLATYPLADAYADLVLLRVAGIDLLAGPPDRAVKEFEEVRRRNPRLLTAEEDEWRAAGAYGAVKEHEPQVVLFRGIFGRRYKLDKAVAETFASLGQHLRAQAYGFEVLAWYPDSAPIVTDWFELSRRYAALKVKEEDPRTKKPRERSMLREAAESLREFIAHFPASAQAAEAQFAVVTSLEALEEWPGERREAEVFEKRYPKSHLLDAALEKALEADFRLGKYQDVLAEAPRIVEGEFLKPDGKYGKSEHAQAALYLVAKSQHILGWTKEAVESYAKLAAKIPDAREALLYLTAREFSAPALVSSPLSAKPDLEVSFRNVKKLALRVYRVDLPVLFAVRKDLKGVSAVNLTGIDPVKAWEVALEGDEAPKKAKLALPAEEKGAYLVVGRSEDKPEGAALVATGGSVEVKEFSSIVLRSDLQIDLQRVKDRVRVHVFRAGASGKREPQPGATVRVFSQNSLKGSGATDARGVFEAPAGQGPVSVLAEHSADFALAES